MLQVDRVSLTSADDQIALPCA
eukprot:SAG11_NODE_31638_length_290_cov_0.816754_1_plen_21_part_10